MNRQSPTPPELPHYYEYDRRCTQKDAMLKAMYERSEREMREFLEKHPNAGNFRKLLFFLFSV